MLNLYFGCLNRNLMLFVKSFASTLQHKTSLKATIASWVSPPPRPPHSHTQLGFGHLKMPFPHTLPTDVVIIQDELKSYVGTNDRG